MRHRASRASASSTWTWRRVGTLLADEGVNIAEYHQARLAAGGDALAVITIDGTPPSHVRDRLTALRDVRNATVIRFGDDT